MGADEIRGGFKLKVVANVDGEVNRQLQQRLDSLTQSFVNLHEAQLSITRGNNIHEYYRTYAASIDGVSEAYKRYVKETNQDNAASLVKSMNAFKAQGGNMEALLTSLGDGFSKIAEQASKMAPAIADAFSVNKLRGYFSAFDELKTLEQDTAEVLNALGSAGAKGAGAAEEAFRAIISKQEAKIKELKAEIAAIGDGTGFNKLTEKLGELDAQFEKVKGKMTGELTTFLNDVGLGSLKDTKEIQQYFDQIKQGSMTSKEAIASIKAEFGALIQDQGVAFDSTVFDSFIARMEGQMVRLEAIANTIEAFRTPTGADNVGGVGAADLKSMEEGLKGIADESSKAGKSMGDASNQALQLVNTIKELSGADEGKLRGIYNIMMTVHAMGRLQGSGSALVNIVSALESLSRIQNLPNLSALSVIDLKGFNELSVKKASLVNLAQYLPTIGNANVSNIAALAAIDFTNLNNLSVSKASVRNLADLAQVYSTVEQLRQRIDAAGIADIGETSDIIPDVDTTDVAAEAAANIEQLAEAHRDAGQAAEEHAQAEAEYAAAETDAASAVGDQPAVHGETAAAAREHADAMREVAEADAAAAENVREAVGETDNAATKLKSVNSELNNIMSLAGKGLNGLMANSEKYGDTEQVDALRDRVAKLGNEISLVRTGQKEASAEAISGYRAEANAIQETLVEITRARSEQDEAKRSAAETIRELNSISNLASKGTSGLTSSKYDSAEVDAVLARIKALNDAMAEYRNGTKTATPDVLSGFREEAAAIQSVIVEMKRMAIASAEAEAASRKAASVETQAVNLKNQISSYINNNSRAYQLYGKTLSSFVDELSKSGGVTAERLQEIRSEFSRIKIAADDAGASGKTFYQTMQEGWKRFGGWSLVTKSFTQIVRLARETVRAVKEIDSAMTELRKVTDLTAAGYDRFYQKAVNVATTIGASVSDTINATADFARLGYNTEDALALAEAGLVYKNVGDGIDSIGQATESVISTLKAFGMESQNAMQIIDEFNEVGNNFAISSTGIGDALVRSASALAGANNTLEESIGLITAANAIVQNPESVGEMMRPAA